MATLSDLLRRMHDYLDEDFGSQDGEVVIDSNKGTIQAIGSPGKSVALDEVFKVGQYVSLDLDGSDAGRLRFVISGVNRDGLDVLTIQGDEGFLPWKLLAATLRRSHRVYVNVLQELGELDEGERALVGEEIRRLSAKLRQQRTLVAVLSEQIDELESIARRPEAGHPSSWLQGG